MPITRDNFNKGRSDGGTRNLVENFLERNKESAYTLDEICSGIYENEKGSEMGLVNAYQIITILHGLVNEGKIIVKDMPDATYYMWK